MEVLSESIIFRNVLTVLKARKQYARNYWEGHGGRKVKSLSEFNAGWIRFIRFLGSHPITLKQTGSATEEITSTYTFTFKIFSWITLYSFIISAIAISYFLNWLVFFQWQNGVEKILKELCRLHLVKSEESIFSNKNGSTALEVEEIPLICLRCLGNVFPLSGFIYVLSNLLSVRFLIQFLNGANDFEQKMGKVFPYSHKISMAHLIRTGSRVLMGSRIAFLALVLTQIPSFIKTAAAIPGNVSDSYVFLTFILMWVTGFFGAFDDSKTFMILHTIKEYYQQIIDSVALRYLEDDAFKNIEHIRNLQILIDCVRKQAKLGFASIQGSTMSSVSALHVILTVSIYLIYHALNRDLPQFLTNYAVGSVVYCTFVFAKLYKKALLAEEILKKEKELADIIRLVGNFHTDVAVDTKFKTAKKNTVAKIEFSFITDLLTSKPSYCVLNRNIMLSLALTIGVFRNVSNYAVALIQLANAQQSWTTTANASLPVNI